MPPKRKASSDPRRPSKRCRTHQPVVEEFSSSSTSSTLSNIDVAPHTGPDVNVRKVKGKEASDENNSYSQRRPTSLTEDEAIDRNLVEEEDRTSDRGEGTISIIRSGAKHRKIQYRHSSHDAAKTLERSHLEERSSRHSTPRRKLVPSTPDALGDDRSETLDMDDAHTAKEDSTWDTRDEYDEDGAYDSEWSRTWKFDEEEDAVRGATSASKHENTLPRDLPHAPASFIRFSGSPLGPTNNEPRAPTNAGGARVASSITPDTPPRARHRGRPSKTTEPRPPVVSPTSDESRPTADAEDDSDEAPIGATTKRRGRPRHAASTRISVETETLDEEDPGEKEGPLAATQSSQAARRRPDKRSGAPPRPKRDWPLALPKKYMSDEMWRTYNLLKEDYFNAYIHIMQDHVGGRTSREEFDRQVGRIVVYPQGRLEQILFKWVREIVELGRMGDKEKKGTKRLLEGGRVKYTE